MKKVHRYAEVLINDKRYPAPYEQRHTGIITFTSGKGRVKTRCGSTGSQVCVTEDAHCVTCKRCL